MPNAKSRRAVMATVLGAIFVLLVALPVVISLTSGDGAVCFTDSACPLSIINPCVRKPVFAVVGRCALSVP
jgi:hypothetical protein